MAKDHEIEKKFLTFCVTHIDFTNISNGKDFYKKVCKEKKIHCGKSAGKVDNRREAFWTRAMNTGLVHSYNSTPAALKRAREIEDGTTPVAEPRRSNRGRWDTP